MTNGRRRPRGYVGKQHETVGSDILAVFGVVGLPKQTLGESLYARLEPVRADGWYPIELLLELMETLDQKLGPNALRQMGRKLFQASHQAHVKANLKTAAELLYGMHGLYERANRGEAIGGWKVLSFGKGAAKLEKTTPHHCVMEEGIVAEALNCLGVPGTVTQEQCFRRGAESCIFVATSVIADEKMWGLPRPGG